MRSLHIAISTTVLSLLSNQVWGQRTNIVPTAASDTFPACALNCAALLQAQATCAATHQPGSVDEGVCFCQYGQGIAGSVQGLFYSSDGACADLCITPSDRTLLQDWFRGYCQEVGTGVNPLTATGATVPTTTTAAATTRTTNAASATDDVVSEGGSVDVRRPTGTAWLHEKWPYVVMVIVLFIGLLGIGLFAVWFKRRLHRKRAQQGLPTTAVANASVVTEGKGSPAMTQDRGAPDLWGPHQHQAASRGYRYNSQDSSATTVAAGAAAKPRSVNRLSGSRWSGFSRKNTSQVEVAEVPEEYDPDQISPQYDIPPRPANTRPRPSELDRDLRAAQLDREQGRDKLQNPAKTNP